MSWPFRALLGPMIWAVAFAVIYGLHGAGCAWGWPDRATPFGNLQNLALAVVWGLFLTLSLGVALTVGRGGDDRVAVIVHAGAWTGFVATALTLFPVLGLTTCG